MDKSSNNNSNNKKKRKANSKTDMFGRGLDVDVGDLPPRLREVPSMQEVGAAANVGILFSLPVAEHIASSSACSSTSSFASSTGDSKPVGVVHSCNKNISAVGLEDTVTASVCGDDNQSTSSNSTSTSKEVWVRCPIGVISQRDGVHACDPTGKPCLSIFRCLGYCAETDTSLVECRPYTGRTHQLRLHLQLLGTPIANDPCYGGVLFYDDAQRRQQAIEAVKEMRKRGIVPLSKVPHFGDAEVDNLLCTVKNSDGCDTTEIGDRGGADAAEDNSTACCDDGGGIHAPAAAVVNMEAIPLVAPLPGESEDDYLMRTCRYCREFVAALFAMFFCTSL